MGAEGSKNGGEAFRKKFWKRLEDLTKNLSVLEAKSLSSPTQKIAWDIQGVKKGGYGITNNMSLV